MRPQQRGPRDMGPFRDSVHVGVAPRSFAPLGPTGKFSVAFECDHRSYAVPVQGDLRPDALAGSELLGSVAPQVFARGVASSQP